MKNVLFTIGLIVVTNSFTHFSAQYDAYEIVMVMSGICFFATFVYSCIYEEDNNMK